MELWRKLRQFGCHALNTSAYILPDTSTCQERFHWLAKQIQDAGGEATVSRVSLIEGMTDEKIVAEFRSRADGDYIALLKDIQTLGVKAKADRAG
ncbi:MAG: Chromate resistance protein ChrB, partial [Candidatus Methylacidiphilales bacterium]